MEYEVVLYISTDGVNKLLQLKTSNFSLLHELNNYYFYLKWSNEIVHND